MVKLASGVCRCFDAKPFPPVALANAIQEER